MISSYEELVQAVLTHEPADLPSLLRSAGYVRVFVDEWVNSNILWLLPHMDITEYCTEYSDSRILFTIYGLKWTAYYDDAYYHTLRRKAETR